MICTRVGGCLKIRTKNWANPQECICELTEKLNRFHAEQERKAINKQGRKKHLSDVEFVNQNARGK